MKSTLFRGALHLRIELELRDSIAAVARCENTTSAEWVRRALRERVASRPSPPHDDPPGPFAPAAAMRPAA